MTDQRVISLIPSATEITAALGCAGRLVGRSHECDYPAGVRALPVCTRPRLHLEGTSAGIDAQVRAAVKKALAIYEVLEDRLRALQPDVIVTQSQCEVCAVSLAEVEAAVCDWVDRQVRIVSLEPNGLADVYDDIARVAGALHVAGAGAALIQRMQETAAAIADRARALSERPRVACIEWTDPLMAAGNWVPELVALAGGEDPFGTPGEHAPGLEWDALADADPDVIMFMPCGFGLEKTGKEAEALAARPGWSDLSAVRAGRVYITNGSDYFNRPGPRLADSLEIMAEILHPQAFRFGHEGTGWRPFSPAT